MENKESTTGNLKASFQYIYLTWCWNIFLTQKARLITFQPLVCDKEHLQRKLRSGQETVLIFSKGQLWSQELKFSWHTHKTKTSKWPKSSFLTVSPTNMYIQKWIMQWENTSYFLIINQSINIINNLLTYCI